MVGTVTVTGIISFFCTVKRFPAEISPSVNDNWIHGYLVFHVVPELTTRTTLFSVTAAGNQTLMA